MIMLLLVVLSTVVWTELVHAQGFGVYEHGACMMARGAAGVAEPCTDGSAVYVNPAGIVGREGMTLGTGGLLVFGSGLFDSDAGGRTTLDTGASIVPQAFFVYGFSPRFALAAGVYVPYGLGVKWPLDFEGRFVSYDARLTSLYVQPTAAYAVNDRISIGGGVTLAVSSVELNRREDLAAVPLGTTGLSFGALVERGTDFANTTLDGSRATGLGIHVGGLVRATERIHIGARYLSTIILTYEGDAAFTPVTDTFRVATPNPLGLPVGAPLDPLVQQVMAALPTQRAMTELTMPAQFVIGASVHATPRLTILGDYQWVGWSVFDTVTLDFANISTPDERLVQNYRNTGAARFGAEFELRPAWRVRGGYAYTQAAAPDETVTPLLPEARRNHLTAGFGWNPRSNVSVDVAYQFIAHDDRRGRTVNPPPGQIPTTALNTGIYRSRGDLIGIMMTYRP